MSKFPPHTILKTSLTPPFAENLKRIIVAMGCFWGAERKFWQLDGVHTTAVGYIAGDTENPSYQEVCTGLTGHTEAVLVVYDPKKISLDELLVCFWESHDPTQGMRQGNDIGTQYRSGVYVDDATTLQAVLASRDQFQQSLTAAGYGSITTEIMLAPTFYYAEDYHQQYLDKNPRGYCGLGGTGIAYQC